MKSLMINKLKSASKAKATKIRNPLHIKRRKKNRLKTLIIMKTSNNVGSQNTTSKKSPLTMNRSANSSFKLTRKNMVQARFIVNSRIS